MVFKGDLMMIKNDWLVVYLPLWKIWKSVGILNMMGKIKAMFQTTNQ